MFSAKGALSFLKAWGNAPGFVKRKTPALKARFNVLALEVNRAFSAYFLWMGSKSWGVVPQAGIEAAPSALNTSLVWLHVFLNALV